MEKKNRVLIAAAVLVFICSTLFFLKAEPASSAGLGWIDEKELGELCIGQVTQINREAPGEKTAKRCV